MALCAVVQLTLFACKQPLKTAAQCCCCFGAQVEIMMALEEKFEITLDEEGESPASPD
jgi:hypothetical protein